MLDTTVLTKNKRNLATSSNIIFKSALLDNEDYFIQNVSLPGITLTAPEMYSSNSPFNTSLVIHPDTVQYDPLDLVFLCDEDLDIWKSVVNKAKNLTTYNENITDTRSWLFIKDSNGNTRKTLTFKDSVIIAVSGLDYSSADTDDTLSFTVTLNYSEFTIESSDVENAPHLAK